MPIPIPNKDEKQDDFIARCMSILNKEYPDNKQRYAICIRQWQKKGSNEGSTDNK